MSQPKSASAMGALAAIASIAAIVFGYTSLQNNNALLKYRLTSETSIEKLNQQAEHAKTQLASAQQSVENLKDDAKNAEETTNEKMSRLDEQVSILTLLVEKKTRENAESERRVEELTLELMLADNRITEIIGDDSYWEKIAASPEVQAKYSPFTSKGTYNLATKRHDSEKKPISFRALQKYNVTTDYRRFARAITGRGQGGVDPHWRNNDRGPKLSRPVTNVDKSAMQKMFEEFKHLGPIWARTGVLRP